MQTTLMFFICRTSRLSIRQNMSPLEDNTLIQRLTNTVHLLHKDNEDDHEDKNMSNILVAKGVTMVILCTVSIAMGILPMRVARRLKWNTSGVENPRYQYNQ